MVADQVLDKRTKNIQIIRQLKIVWCSNHGVNLKLLDIHLHKAILNNNNKMDKDLCKIIKFLINKWVNHKWIRILVSQNSNKYQTKQSFYPFNKLKINCMVLINSEIVNNNNIINIRSFQNSDIFYEDKLLIMNLNNIF